MVKLMMMVMVRLMIVLRVTLWIMLLIMLWIVFLRLGALAQYSSDAIGSFKILPTHAVAYAFYAHNRSGSKALGKVSDKCRTGRSKQLAPDAIVI